MAVSKEDKEQIKNLRDRQRQIDREIEEIKERSVLAQEMSVWMKITEIKNDIQSRIDAENIPYTLRKIATLPSHYIYQHPQNLKLKSSNLDDDWVKEHLAKKSGSVEELVATADKTRMSTWKRAIATKKRKGNSGDEEDGSGVGVLGVA